MGSVLLGGSGVLILCGWLKGLTSRHAKSTPARLAKIAAFSELEDNRARQETCATCRKTWFYSFLSWLKELSTSCLPGGGVKPFSVGYVHAEHASPLWPSKRLGSSVQHVFSNCYGKHPVKPVGWHLSHISEAGYVDLRITVLSTRETQHVKEKRHSLNSFKTKKHPLPTLVLKRKVIVMSFQSKSHSYELLKGRRALVFSHKCVSWGSSESCL